jgi:hypothetical protein
MSKIMHLAVEGVNETHDVPFDRPPTFDEEINGEPIWSWGFVLWHKPEGSLDLLLCEVRVKGS